MEFRNCLFAFAHFYGATLERCRFVDCDFIEYNGFSNCEFRETVFEDCFFDDSKFHDCKFGDSVVIRNTKSRRSFALLHKAARFNSILEKKHISTIYQGIKDAYSAGEVWKLSRRYRFLQNKFYTKYHLEGVEKIGGYFWEYLSGYGLKPVRVLGWLGILFVSSYCWFSFCLGNWKDTIILAAGALFTFGAKSELLEQLSTLNRVIYICLAFAGVSLTALFVTVMANVHLNDR